ncbi:MAG: hypothetical protein B6I36_04140 [Desulfobacteraceae bacterium 4572_35.1]|nr:MAG: hypothetical protein B6I36_04140 [Desulfobacteraceae bacterium 4572_35.1]
MAAKKLTTGKTQKNRSTPGKKQPTATKSAKKSKTQNNTKQHALLAIIFLVTVSMVGLFIVTNWPTPHTKTQNTAAQNTAVVLHPTPDNRYKPVENPESSNDIGFCTPDSSSSNEITADSGIAKQNKIAIIMDDMGINLSLCTAAINLDIPITCSIFPGKIHSREIMELAHEHQREIMIHIPMEPVNYPKNNPGVPALFARQSDAEITETTKQFIVQSPYATGGNNHMGSEFTQHADKIDVVLQQLKQHHLFFVDSLTISNSVAYKEAQRLNIPSAKRNFFLDNERNIDKILQQLQRLVNYARHNHHAIGICHPYPETIAALTEFASTFAQYEVQIVPVAKLVQLPVQKQQEQHSLQETDSTGTEPR